MLRTSLDSNMKFPQNTFVLLLNAKHWRNILKFHRKQAKCYF